MPELLTIALFPLVGLAVVLALRINVPSDAAGRAGLLFLLGAGMSGTLLFAAGVARLPFFASTIALGAGSLIVVGWRLITQRRPEATAETRARRRKSPASLVALVAPFVIVSFATAILPLADYDGRATWLPKAQAIVAENGISGPFFRGEHGLNLHSRYPLLLPIDGATLMKVSGDPSERAVRWLYALIPLAFLLYARSVVSRESGAWIVAAAAWLPMIVAAPEGSALSAYADLAVMAFAGAAVLSLLDGEAALSACWLSCLVLTKNEGTTIGMAIVLSLLILRPARRVWIWSTGAFVAAALLLRGWWLGVPAAYDERYDVLVRHLPERVWRVPHATRALFGHAVTWSKWGGFWIAVALALIVVLVKARTRRTGFVAAVLLLGLGSYVLAFTVTSWQNVGELANVAADRLLAQLIGPACLLLAFSWDALAGNVDRQSTDV